MTQILVGESWKRYLTEKTPRVVGRQVYGNLYDCDPRLLADSVYLESVIREAAEIGNMKLLDIKAWKIGLGVSIVGIILESHISIHTWPEYGFATVDVYSCGAHTDPEKAFDYIVKALKAGRVEKGYADRSLF
ncbi:MAG: adenosylmethionine decarboxylase [Sulfolobales archaeon]